MFTGLVDHLATVMECCLLPHESGQRLTLKTQFRDLCLGESIAVDGVCLTVTQFDAEGRAQFDVSPETRSLTTLGDRRAGDSVNVERALRVGDRLGGHFVTGHVDHVAQVSAIKAVGAYTQLAFSGLPAQCLPYLVPKGSITINGVSLTVNTTEADGFSVLLVPHTLARTNLSHLVQGSSVNLEYDLLARFVAKQIATSMQPEREINLQPPTKESAS